LKIGKIDANKGLLLEFDSVSQSWVAVPQVTSGFSLEGEVTSAQLAGDHLWIGSREHGLRSFTPSK
jgi:hypothetical protein